MHEPFRGIWSRLNARGDSLFVIVSNLVIKLYFKKKFKLLILVSKEVCSWHTIGTFIKDSWHKYCHNIDSDKVYLLLFCPTQFHNKQIGNVGMVLMRSLKFYSCVNIYKKWYCSQIKFYLSKSIEINENLIIIITITITILRI